MSPEAELIRALAEDLALEILAAYSAEDFADADFTTLGKAAVYLADHGSAAGPALEELIAKVQRAADTDCATYEAAGPSCRCAGRLRSGGDARRTTPTDAAGLVSEQCMPAAGPSQQ